MIPGAEAHPEARAEFLEAVDRYEAEEHGLGEQFRAAVYEALARVTSGLVSGSRSPESASRREIRRLVLTRFPYDVVFQRRAGKIVVLAVAHQHRKPGYWRGRTTG